MTATTYRSSRRRLSAYVIGLLRYGPTCACHGDIASQLRQGVHAQTAPCCESCLPRCGREARSIFWSIVLGMVNSNWDEPDAWCELMNPLNIGGTYLQDRGRRSELQARRVLQRSWLRACGWTASNPLPTDPFERVAQLTAILDLVETRPYLFSSGQAGVSERAAMRALIGRGLRSSSLIVLCPRLSLMQWIDCTEKTAGRVLSRLVARGVFLSRYEAATTTKAAKYLLVLPRADMVTSYGCSTPAGTSSDGVVLSATVHRLFGTSGLTRGSAETLARLPLLEQPTGHGLLIAIRKPMPPGTFISTLRRSISGLDGLPGMQRGPGVTAEDVAQAAGKSVRTVRRHLRRLQAMGLVTKKGECWYRPLCAADVVADDLRIPHTVEQKTELARRRRSGWRDYQSSTERLRSARQSQQGIAEGTRDVDRLTGEILPPERGGRHGP
jgi:DNA-binding transcriptional ArsR family regulator